MTVLASPLTLRLSGEAETSVFFASVFPVGYLSCVLPSKLFFDKV